MAEEVIIALEIMAGKPKARQPLTMIVTRALTTPTPPPPSAIAIQERKENFPHDATRCAATLCSTPISRQYTYRGCERIWGEVTADGW